LLATLLLPATGAPIEPKLTTTQLDRAKKLLADWRELDFTRMKATAIPFPGKADQTCPLM